MNILRHFFSALDAHTLWAFNAQQQLSRRG
jgi:hypothetical protein